jgi:malonyl-CoA/methylmalonyl-CoA synthetase
MARMTAHFVNELRSVFADRATRAAVVHRDRDFTYAELDERARRAAAWLQGLGVEPGDRVLLCTAEKLPFLVAHLGALFAGAVALPVNPRFPREELRYVLDDSGARVAVVGDQPRPLVEELRPSLPALTAVVPDTDAWDAPAARPREYAIAPNDACLMIYSSGTTGRPKGVVHTPANLSASLRALQACWRITADDVVVNALPLFHIHGLSFACLLPLLAGGCVHIEDAFHARNMLDAIGRGTILMSIPTFYYAFLDEPAFRDAARSWQHVRLFTCGSAPIRSDVLPELESILGRPVINRYGMTEAHVIASLPLDGPWPRGSVGLPVAGINLQVVREHGVPTAAGESGSVRVRGPNLFREYWRKPDATREAFASGWFDTGDIGQLDAAGFLTLVGRKNDLIITNGFNVYPQVVERVINSCPGVRESAVVGVPDARRGESVLAAVVRQNPLLDESQLRDYWAGHLAGYERPAKIVFVDSLPRNALGKVLRGELRNRFAAEGS